MKEWLTGLIEHIRNLEFAIPAAIGGFIDFFNKIRLGKTKYRYFPLHMLTAIFFGWLLGNIIFGLTHSIDLVAAAGAVGGFLGAYTPKLILYDFLKIDQRK